MKFRNTKEENTAKAILETGKNEKFWEIICKSIDESIAYIEEQQDSEDMRELSPEMYKLTNELFKAKKEYLRTLKNTPDNILSWLEKPVSERQSFDPYDS